MKLYSITITLFTALSFCACTDNPKDEDPISTITPGNGLKVDTAVAHANNSIDSLKPQVNTNKDIKIKAHPNVKPAAAATHSKDSVK